MIDRCVCILVARVFTAILVGGTLLSCAETGRMAEPAGGKSASLLEMPPSKFLETPYPDRSIEKNRLDQALMAAALYHETNLRRQEGGKRQLARDSRLDEAARLHAASMARHDYLSHTDPHQPERRTPQDRALLAGFKPRYLSENVANHFTIRYEPGRKVFKVQTAEGAGFSYQPGAAPIAPHTYKTFASSLLDQWMNSPGHRKNILADPPEFFGSGCAPRTQGDMPMMYCVQLFGSLLK